MIQKYVNVSAIMKLKTKQDAKEKLLTAALFTGIFLPTRLFFYTYVSQVWIGSFGLITSIMIIMMVLARKGKLGKVGTIVNRQMMSFSKGKFGKFAMIQTIFFIYIFALAIYGIENPPVEMKEQIIGTLAAEGIDDLESSLAGSENLVWTGPAAVLGPLFALLVILVPNTLGFSMYSIINDFTDGWLLHFITVFMIEHLEILGLVIYFRYFYKHPKELNDEH